MFLIDLCSPSVKHPHTSSLVSSMFSLSATGRFRLLGCKSNPISLPTNLDALYWCSFFIPPPSSPLDKMGKRVRKTYPRADCQTPAKDPFSPASNLQSCHSFRILTQSCFLFLQLLSTCHHLWTFCVWTPWCTAIGKDPAGNHPCCCDW